MLEWGSQRKARAARLTVLAGKRRARRYAAWQAQWGTGRIVQPEREAAAELVRQAAALARTLHAVALGVRS